MQGLHGRRKLHRVRPPVKRTHRGGRTPRFRLNPDSEVAELDARSVQWVTRAKDKMLYRALKNLTKGHENVIKDQIVVLEGKHKGMQVRRVEAWVGVVYHSTMQRRSNGIVYHTEERDVPLCPKDRKSIVMELPIFIPELATHLGLKPLTRHESNDHRLPNFVWGRPFKISIKIVSSILATPITLRRNEAESHTANLKWV